MKVYIIRHGESETNIAKCHTGWLDVKLTEKGENDACSAGKLLNGIKFDKVYSSDLNRAVSTQKLALPEYDAETTPLLREINVGDLSGEPFAVSIKKYGEAYNTNTQIGNYSYFNGENVSDFEKRIKEFFTMLENKDYENVAVFCHSGTVRSTLNVLLNSQIPLKNLACDNGSIAVFEYTNGIWKLNKWNYSDKL